MCFLGLPNHCLRVIAEDLDKLINVLPNEVEQEAIQKYVGDPEDLRDVEQKVRSEYLDRSIQLDYDLRHMAGSYAYC